MHEIQILTKLLTKIIIIYLSHLLCNKISDLIN